MAMDGAFDRALTLFILALLGWIIYESRKGNKILDRFVGQKNKIDMDGSQFGIRKH